jgi:hypothetical protein
MLLLLVLHRPVPAGWEMNGMMVAVEAGSQWRFRSPVGIAKKAV